MAGDLRDRLLQTHGFIKETAESEEQDSSKLIEFANHLRVSIKANGNTSRSFNRRREEVREQRAREHPRSGCFRAQNLTNGSKLLFLNAGDSERSSQSHPHWFTAKVTSRTKHTRSAKAQTKCSATESTPSHLINELQQERDAPWYYLTLWGKLILLSNRVSPTTK